jgi:hypothetical protein
MTVNRIIRLVTAVLVLAGGLAWNGEFVPGPSTGYVSRAEAVIGRPLTPVSYAGVARRTVRRCAVGVYYC